MRYTVPQFIDTEDKILGPITTRQFLIMLVVVLIDALLFRLLDFIAFLVFGIPIFAVGGIFAFFKVNGQPFHFFVLNLVQTLRRPGLRVWDKDPTDSELKLALTEAPAPAKAKKIVKRPLEGSKLAELSLVLNTGGVYNPEE